MSQSSDLVSRQQWLLTRILIGPKGNQDVTAHIQGTETLPASARLAIYQDGYRLRLLECMVAEFPALHLYLGEDLFRLFCIGYLEHQPSHHYSLYELGDGFGDFLSRTRPSEDQVPPAVAACLKIPEQLALLERARASALRAEGCEQLSVPDLGTVLSWPPLILPASSQLLETGFTLYDYLQQADAYIAARETGQSISRPETPTPSKESILVFRHRYRVSMVRLERWQAELINTLADTAPHPPSWQAIVTNNSLPEAQLLARLSVWLPKALALSQLKLADL